MRVLRAIASGLVALFGMVGTIILFIVVLLALPRWGARGLHDVPAKARARGLRKTQAH